MVKSSKALAKSESTNSNALISFNEEEVELIKTNIAPEATDAQFKLFIYDCQSRGLNPLKNEIHWVARQTKFKDANGMWKSVLKGTHQVGIDGFRIIAQRSGEYRGQTEVNYSEDEFKIDGVDVPEWAEVGVYREGFKEPVISRAYFNEYAQVFNKNGAIQLGTMWKKMPRLMLAKCAEALALRKAFPDSLAGLYTNDEMAQSDNEAFPSRVKDVSKKEESIDDIIPNTGKGDDKVLREFAKLFDKFAELNKWSKEEKRENEKKLLNGKDSLLDVSENILKQYCELFKKKIKEHEESKSTVDIAEEVFDTKSE